MKSNSVFQTYLLNIVMSSDVFECVHAPLD